MLKSNKKIYQLIVILSLYALFILQWRWYISKFARSILSYFLLIFFNFIGIVLFFEVVDTVQQYAFEDVDVFLNL